MDFCHYLKKNILFSLNFALSLSFSNFSTSRILGNISKKYFLSNIYIIFNLYFNYQ